jgi:hypothetical protein
MMLHMSQKYMLADWKQNQTTGLVCSRSPLHSPRLGADRKQHVTLNAVSRRRPVLYRVRGSLA